MMSISYCPSCCSSTALAASVSWKLNIGKGLLLGLDCTQSHYLHCLCAMLTRTRDSTSTIPFRRGRPLHVVTRIDVIGRECCLPIKWHEPHRAADHVIPQRRWANGEVWLLDQRMMNALRRGRSATQNLGPEAQLFHTAVSPDQTPHSQNQYNLTTLSSSAGSRSWLPFEDVYIASDADVRSPGTPNTHLVCEVPGGGGGGGCRSTSGRPPAPCHSADEHECTKDNLMSCLSVVYKFQLRLLVRWPYGYRCMVGPTTLFE